MKSKVKLNIRTNHKEEKAMAPKGGKATVRAGASSRKVPAGTTVAELKAIIVPEGRDAVLIRGGRVLNDGERIRAGQIYVLQPRLAGA